MEEYNEKDLGKAGICEVCDKPGTVVLNPYQQDVYNTVVYECLCDFCLDRIKDDI